MRGQRGGRGAPPAGGALQRERRRTAIGRRRCAATSWRIRSPGAPALVTGSETEGGQFQNSSSLAGTEVRTQIRIFKVEDIDMVRRLLLLKVWYRLEWIDERLIWDPAAYGGLSLAYFDASEIWTPDVQPWNVYKERKESADQTLAKVAPSGWVYWSRRREFQVLCKFSGLVAFPKDRLACQLEVGGWTYSGIVQGLIMADPPIAVEESEHVDVVVLRVPARGRARRAERAHLRVLPRRGLDRPEVHDRGVALVHVLLRADHLAEHRLHPPLDVRLLHPLEDGRAARLRHHAAPRDPARQRPRRRHAARLLGAAVRRRWNGR